GLLAVALACLAIDWAWIYGKVHSLRADIPPGGLEPGTEIYRRFFFWHGISMTLNAVIGVLAAAALAVSLWPRGRT
ncbi:MAG: hypothetical protein ACOC46_01580, partial [Pirellulales bacterium]